MSLEVRYLIGIVIGVLTAITGLLIVTRKADTDQAFRGGVVRWD